MPKNPDDYPILRLALKHVRPIMLTRLNRTSCVAGARILIDALGHFGYYGQPQAVTAFILNNDARLMMESGATLPDIYREALKYEVSDPGGPWTMGLGHDDGDPSGVGHVVVYLPEFNGFMDATADQVNRPHKHIILKPMLLDGNPEEFHYFYIPQDDGEALIVYHPDEGDRFKKSPNWRGISAGNRRTIPDLTGQVIRAIKEDLLSEKSA
jgi:hypothetical protein